GQPKLFAKFYAAPRSTEFPFHGHKGGFEPVIDRRREDAPRLATEFAPHDLIQRVSLLGRGFYVDPYLCSATAFMDGAWPFDHHCKSDSVESNIAASTLRDPQSPTTFAEPSRRWCIEIAGATPITITGAHDVRPILPGR